MDEKMFVYTHHFSDSDSEVVRGVYYNVRSKELHVVLNSGNVAGYLNVPSDIFVDFREAKSRGKFWNKVIKKHFNGTSGADSFQYQAYYDSLQQETQESEPSPDPKKPTYSVTVHVDGTLRFDVHDQHDALEAAQYVKTLIGNAVVDGIAFIKEVKVLDEGN